MDKVSYLFGVPKKDVDHAIREHRQAKEFRLQLDRAIKHKYHKLHMGLADALMDENNTGVAWKSGYNTALDEIREILKDE